MKTYTPAELAEVVRLHDMWRRGEEGGARADLSHADLSHAHLHGANLRSAILTGANLSRADLSHADLHGAILTGANMHSANLYCTVLSRTDLRDASLCYASLYYADLTCADLRKTDLRGVKLAGANLASCRGVQYVQFSFQGLGAESRQWSAVKIGGVWQAFCGCWSGTLEELKVRISMEKAEEIKLTGYTDVSASREVAHETMVRLCQESDRRNITKP